MDDNEVDRMAVRRALEKANVFAEIHEAPDVSTAFQLLRARPLDCVIIDYMLPDGDGLDLLKAIADSGGNATPVVVLTGHGSAHVAVEFMKAGVADYLPKSELTPSRIAQAIRHAIRVGEAESAVRRAHVELEEKVRLRTAELSASNARLQDEIEQRRSAHEKLIAFQEKLRSLASQLALAEERERQRIATGIQDEIGQRLALIKIRFRSLEVASGPGPHAHQFEPIRQILDEVIQNLRSLTFELGSPILYRFGLEAALEQLAEQFELDHGVHTTFEDAGRAKPLKEDLKVTVFQAVRELLFNVAKHARASNVSLTVRLEDGALCIRIADDGVGFDPSGADGASAGSDGFGLFNVQKTLEYLGTRLQIDSSPGRGTSITIIAPCADGGEQKSIHRTALSRS